MSNSSTGCFFGQDGNHYNLRHLLSCYESKDGKEYKCVWDIPGTWSQVIIGTNIRKRTTHKFSSNDDMRSSLKNILYGASICQSQSSVTTMALAKEINEDKNTNKQ